MYDIDIRQIVCTIPTLQQPIITIKPPQQIFILKPYVSTYTAPTVNVKQIVLLLSYE